MWIKYKNYFVVNLDYVRCLSITEYDEPEIEKPFVIFFDWDDSKGTDHDIWCFSEKQERDRVFKKILELIFYEELNEKT